MWLNVCFSFSPRFFISPSRFSLVLCVLNSFTLSISLSLSLSLCLDLRLCDINVNSFIHFYPLKSYQIVCTFYLFHHTSSSKLSHREKESIHSWTYLNDIISCRSSSSSHKNLVALFRCAFTVSVFIWMSHNWKIWTKHEYEREVKAICLINHLNVWNFVWLAWALVNFCTQQLTKVVEYEWI